MVLVPPDLRVVGELDRRSLSVTHFAVGGVGHRASGAAASFTRQPSVLLAESWALMATMMGRQRHAAPTAGGINEPQGEDGARGQGNRDKFVSSGPPEVLYHPAVGRPC